MCLRIDTMELNFLGTSAADYSDKLKNEYRNCFDKNFRRSSSINIGKSILVDCGPHTIDSLNILGYKLEDIENILITHTHSDHFNYQNIEAIANCIKNLLTYGFAAML